MTMTHPEEPLKSAVLFTCGVACLTLTTGFLIDDMRSPWALLFVMSPLLVATALRLTRDGWADAGLRLTGALRWYAVAALVFPLLGALSLGVGWVTGDVAFTSGAGERLTAGIAGGLLPALLFAAGEEWGWRGYLEPRLAAAGVTAAKRHLTVGLIWGVWHVPYILALGPEYTPLPLFVQLPLFHLAVVAMAFLWGALRTLTGSVWPAVLGHGLANAVAFPLLDPEIVSVTNPLVFAVRPEGLIVLPGLAVAAWAAFRVARLRCGDQRPAAGSSRLRRTENPSGSS